MEILKGVPASEGIAIGRIYCYEPQTYTGAEAYFEGDPAAQIAAFCRAKEHALAELSALAEELSAIPGAGKNIPCASGNAPG